MTQLQYFTAEVLEELRRTIAERLDWYYSPDRDLPGLRPSDRRQKFSPSRTGF